jgi:hypothetical protein
LLLATLPMTACQTTALTGASKADAAIAAGVCSAWPGVSYDSKLDTPATTASARAANRARTAYCKGDTK